MSLFWCVFNGIVQTTSREDKKIIKNVIIHHLQHVSISDVYNAEVLGVTCLPKCGERKCGRCPRVSYEIQNYVGRKIDILKVSQK